MQVQRYLQQAAERLCLIKGSATFSVLEMAPRTSPGLFKGLKSRVKGSGLGFRVEGLGFRA